MLERIPIVATRRNAVLTPAHRPPVYRRLAISRELVRPTAGVATRTGFPHHITQRGNRRQPTFFCDEDYQSYVELIRICRHPCSGDKSRPLSALIAGQPRIARRWVSAKPSRDWRAATHRQLPAGEVFANAVFRHPRLARRWVSAKPSRPATAQVDCPAQTQSLGNLSQPLAAGREEAAENAPLFQLLQPRLPRLGGRADSLEDLGHARDIIALPSRNRRPL